MLPFDPPENIGTSNNFYVRERIREKKLKTKNDTAEER